MSFDYAPILAIVNDVLPQFGTDCEALTIVTEYEFNDPIGVPKEIITTGKGVKDEIKRPFGDYANTVETGDMAFICTASLALQTGSVITIDGEKWRVIDPRPIKPGNLLLGYQAHIRRVS